MDPVVAPDPFIGRVVGQLTVIRRELRGGRWGYVCQCSCGAVTPAMRAAYISRRGELAACYDCSHARPDSGVPVRSGGAPLLRGEREQPTNAEPEDDHEEASAPIWRTRSRLLAKIILRPMPSAAVVVLAKARFGWADDLTREVLAAAEGAELVKNFGLWKRNAARTMTSLVSSRPARSAKR